MSKETGGPAFPVSDLDHQIFKPGTFDEAKRLLSGMDLRDYLAAKALQGDWASQDAQLGYLDNDVSDEVLINRSRIYWRIADAMLKTRGE